MSLYLLLALCLLVPGGLLGAAQWWLTARAERRGLGVLLPLLALTALGLTLGGYHAVTGLGQLARGLYVLIAAAALLGTLTGSVAGLLCRKGRKKGD